jgi:lysozyme
MRRFDPQETAWLERLVVVARTGPIQAAAFLARMHFSRAAGRGLILQPRGHFGYCYVRPARLAAPGAAQEERHALMALLLLLAWLRRERYLAVEYEDGDDTPPLVVLGEAFDAVRPERSRVVLNAEGDYSRDPRQVLHADGTVAYEGLRLEGDACSLAHDWARGTLHASLALEELLALVRPPLPPTPAPVVAAPVPIEGPVAPRREPRHWSLRRLVAKAKTLGAEAGAVVGVAHAAIWVLGFLTATIAGLHLGGAFSPNGLGPRPDRTLAVAPLPTPTRQGLVPLPRPPAAPTAGSVMTASFAAPAASAPATAAMGAPGPGGILYGLDVSKWNGDWVDSLHGSLAGISFVFVRASDGLTADPAFGRHWNAVRSNGLVRGSYHFYRVDADPEQQARLYLRMLGGAPEEADITPVLDFEEDSFPTATPPAKDKVQADLLRALQALERLGGRVPMIYTNWDTGTHWLDDERFARYPLWIADWSRREAPRLPAAWIQQGFRFWQRTDHYQPPSPDKLAMDLDWFIGRREDLVR